MSTFTLLGREFPLAEKLTFAEIDYAENLAHKPQEEWTQSTAVRASVLISCRRVDTAFITWQGLGDISPEDLEFDDEDEDQEAEVPAENPPADAGQTGASEGSPEQPETGTSSD